jgi:hypothetical protein
MQNIKQGAQMPESPIQKLVPYSEIAKKRKQSLSLNIGQRILRHQKLPWKPSKILTLDFRV